MARREYRRRSFRTLLRARRGSFLRVCVVGLALCMMLPSAPAKAEFTLVDRAEAWFFYMQRGVGRSYAACQVVSCVRGVCAAGGTSRTQFSLYDARDGHGVNPEFVSPSRVPPGGQATLRIGSDSYALRNRLNSPQFYLQAENGPVSKAIVESLVALEATNARARFVVEDARGRVHEFTVRGVTESLERMERRCTRRY